MELTRIKVRGKKRDRNEQLVVPSPPKPLNRDRHQRKQAMARRPQASNIEKSMPLEVLERIFWFSENVNLPRASPRLGRLLSGASTLRETFLAAFGPTWDVWFGCIDWQGPPGVPKIHSYVGWDQDADRFGGNPAFQTDLLACSWTTVDMILDCWDLWVRRHARHRPFEHLSLWGKPIEPISYTGSGVTVGISHIKEARCYFYHDYHAFRNVEKQNDYAGGLPFRLDNFARSWVQVHRFTEIPEDLLTGPWDEGSLQKLFWLVQAGARLSAHQTWEVTLEGFHNAISDKYAPNLTVLRLLRFLDAFMKWPKHVRLEEFHKLDAIMPSLKTNDNTALHAKYTYIEHLLIRGVLLRSS
ncbi:hypothetical protein F5Y14DRAFT_288181 [Nemania sp. NC0429]|nr:hypothetical protein F5Y14DRAFT_288181 [Nemania sp. NC0429]